MRSPQIGFPQLVQDYFFLCRLIAQRGASARTVEAYRDAIELLRGFAERRTGKPPSALRVGGLAVRPAVRIDTRMWPTSPTQPFMDVLVAEPMLRDAVAVVISPVLTLIQRRDQRRRAGAVPPGCRRGLQTWGWFHCGAAAPNPGAGVGNPSRTRNA
jgi:hypothetical protein